MQKPKFGSIKGDEWVAHEYSKIYSVEHIKGGDRLCIAVGHGGSDLMQKLASALHELFFILYVLVIPRGGATAGRYQSPSMSRGEANQILTNFSLFFDGDGRHHVWLYSQTDKRMLIYDRHNIVYAYGPLEEYRKELHNLGYTLTDSVEVPTPHAHNYIQEYDHLEQELTTMSNWTFSPLQPGDER